ncbi:acetylornithine deacetylase/Succinyl-diaminopimelate desuccinylase and related deacylases [Methylobacterium aquaticum]|uniref:Acetylornithine deacetylase/Succinyl-diaminopimelate desuccinylase and related deacylases n=1 Tax=Methylobacterium aquaticum TaxID=270351 RepID=A0A0C6FF50_9HYPH|nr:acetylornithine deacetylase/Succinyl-diaminopimelate desuccinylase and related deacylases [Methylobacterium aquaticum]
MMKWAIRSVLPWRRTVGARQPGPILPKAWPIRHHRGASARRAPNGFAESAAPSDKTRTLRAGASLAPTSLRGARNRPSTLTGAITRRREPASQGARSPKVPEVPGERRDADE